VALNLNIDGKRIEEPGPADIARGFEELGKGAGFFKGPGITIAVLARDETHELMATGTRAAGFMLSYKDGEADCEYITGPEQAVKFEEAIRIFQSYARGDDWGQSNFQWERLQVFEKTPKVIKRLLIIAVLGFLAFMLVRRFIAK
jgi:hypothetical protein